MIATRDIAAGEELVNNYGELSQVVLMHCGRPVLTRQSNEPKCTCAVKVRPFTE